MSFVRHGTPEPMQTIKFRCTQCGNEAVALTNGKCNTCNTQIENVALKEGIERIKKEEEEKGVEPPKEKK